MIKRGTKVIVDGAAPESARITNWHPTYGKREEIPGYHPVKFDADGAILMVHESRLTVMAALS